MALSPYSPKATVPPRQALPVIRPRCCFRYLTFFGINMVMSLDPIGQSWDRPALSHFAARAIPARAAIAIAAIHTTAVFLFASDARCQPLALVEPHLDADLPVSGVRLGEAVVDVRPQGLQRQLPVQVPLRARDFGAVQPAGDAHLDPAGAEAQRRFHGLAHRAAERDALFQLHRDRLADELRVELRLLDLLDVDEDLAARPLLD